MPIETTPFDASEFFTDPEDQLDLLREAFASGEPGFITAALRTVAKARGMTRLAEETGLTRAGLYKALSGDGDPKLSTLIKIMGSMGLKLTWEPANISAASKVA